MDLWDAPSGSKRSTARTPGPPGRKRAGRKEANRERRREGAGGVRFRCPTSEEEPFFSPLLLLSFSPCSLLSLSLASPASWPVPPHGPVGRAFRVEEINGEDARSAREKTSREKRSEQGEKERRSWGVRFRCPTSEEERFFSPLLLLSFSPCSLVSLLLLLSFSPCSLLSLSLASPASWPSILSGAVEKRFE
jgi:hypothetical protein